MLTFRVSPQTTNSLPPHHEKLCWAPMVTNFTGTLYLLTQEELCLPPVNTDFTVQLAPNCNAHLCISVLINSSPIQTYIEDMWYLQVRVSNSHPKFRIWGSLWLFGRRKCARGFGQKKARCDLERRRRSEVWRTCSKMGGTCGRGETIFCVH